MALDIDHFTIVEQSVEYGGGNDWIAKQFLPVTEALVGSDNSGAPFIPVRQTAINNTSIMYINLI